MAQIVFLGAMHDDPSGKDRLRRAVRDLNDGPAFLGLEYAQATHAALVSKRDGLKDQLRSRFPRRGEAFIDQLTKTLAYEPDLASEIKPNLTPVWMLNGSPKDDVILAGPSLAERGASVKMTNYTDWLFPRIPNLDSLDDADLLAGITGVYMRESARLAAITEPDVDLVRSVTAGRDSRMFSQLQEFIVTNRVRHGVVIVGTGHLHNVSGSLLNLCLSSGLAIETIWPHEQLGYRLRHD